MGKNIIIQEGGVGKQLTADKLKTNLVGGGTCLWVPEDETRLGTKYISKNGTYKASDDDYYGYSEVTVSGIGTATGTGEDGETHQYTEDGDGGIIDTILPDSIVVESPPTVTEYSDGATIDFSGMVVKGYLKSGDLWTDSSHPDGIIPISELTLPVTTADSGSTSGEKASSSLIPEPFEFSSRVELIRGPMDSSADDYAYFSDAGGAILVGRLSSRSIKGLHASASQNDVEEDIWYYARGGSDTDTITKNRSYTYDGKTVFFGGWTSGWGFTNKDIKSLSPDGTNTLANYSEGAIAWTMIYGTIIPGGQVIPVQYMSGEKTLESSFTITVGQAAPTSPSDGDDESGNGQWIDLL